MLTYETDAVRNASMLVGYAANRVKQADFRGMHSSKLPHRERGAIPWNGIFLPWEKHELWEHLPIETSVQEKRRGKSFAGLT